MTTDDPGTRPAPGPDDESFDPGVSLPEDPTISINLGRSLVPGATPLDSQFETLDPQPGSPDSPQEPPATLDRDYRLVRVIGRGGYGEIWQAVQNSLGRTIAIKRMRPDLKARMGDTPGDAASLDQLFRQEALTTGRLEHPNIVPVYDLGTGGDGVPMLAMKLVRGRAWSDLIREDAGLPPTDFLARHVPILVSMAQAVAFAHSRGIVHRDLKPAQVMVGEFGEVVLMDWGLAVLFDPSLHVEEADEHTPGGFAHATPTLDTATNPSGTAAYMAPEQSHRDASGIGPWTDIYLIGATLYQLLTLTVPHDAPTTLAAMSLAARGILEPPGERAPERNPPRELAELCMACMQFRPVDRPAGVKEVIARIEDWSTGAGKRRESRALTEDVAARFKAAAGSYEELAACDGDLERALALWAENGEAAALRERVVEEYARAAARNGDLVLGRQLTRRLGDAAAGAEIEEEIGRVERQRARNARQRRLALGATALLAVTIATSALVVQNTRARALEQQRLAVLLDQVNELRREENALALRLARALPIPDELPVRSDWGTVSRATIDISAGDGLLARREELRAKRGDLVSRLPPGKLEPEPFELVLADASLRFHRATARADYVAAHDLYERAARIFPEAPPPAIAAGVAAAHAGHPTSATLALADAARRTKALRGDNHPEYGRVLGLWSESLMEAQSERALAGELAAESLGILQPQWVRSTHELASRLILMSDYESALELTSTTLPLMMAYSGENVPMRLRSQIRHIEVLALRGGKTEALELSRRLFRDSAEVLGPDDRVTLEVGLILVHSLDGVGDHAGAVELARDLLARIGDDPAYQTLRLQLEGIVAAGVFHMGDYEKGVELVRRSAEQWAAAFGEDYPDALKAKAAYGTALIEYGDLPEAERILKEVYRLRLRLYPQDRPGNSATALNVASTLSEQERYDEALPYFLIGVEGMLASLGPQHPDTGAAFNNIASSLTEMDRNEESLPLSCAGFRIIRGAIGHEYHPYIGVLYNNFAETYKRMGDFGKTNQFFDASLHVLLNAFGADSPRHPFVERVFHGIARARHDHFRAEPTPANTRLALETNWLSYRLALGQRANFTPSQFAGPVVSPLERLPRILLAMDPPRPELARTVMEHCWQLNRMMARFDPRIAEGDFLPAQITEAGLDLAEFEALPEPPDFWTSPEEAIDVAPVLQWLDDNHGPLPEIWELYPDFRRAPADFEVPGEQSLPPVHAIIDGMADDADAIIARLRVEYADEIDRARRPAGDAP